VSRNPRGFLNILSRLTTVELYLVFNLERHLCALEIERQEAVQRHEELRSAFLTQEVIQADDHIRNIIEIASHRRPEPNYQNDTRTEEQNIADGLAFANNQRHATQDPRTRNHQHEMERPDQEVPRPAPHRQRHASARQR
jgi:hypothetical protein